MKFTSEADARKWIREAFPATLFVEHAPGGTPGVPDCLIPVYNATIPCELKVAKKPQLAKLLRPSQKRVLELFTSMRILSIVLVGIRGSEHVFATNMLNRRTLSTTKHETFRQWLDSQIAENRPQSAPVTYEAGI